VRCGSRAGKCVIFLFAYWGVFDCFSGKADAKNSIQYSVFKWQKKYIRKGMASAFPLKQLLLICGK